jgi:hypothetical protein
MTRSITDDSRCITDNSRSITDDSRSTTNKNIVIIRMTPQLGASLTDNYRNVIYNQNVYIKQATWWQKMAADVSSLSQWHI